MFRWITASSALVLATLALSPAAQAQGFFGFYDVSPRDVLSRLDDQGYMARIPMTRRGDVYVVDAQTSSGRSVRLIVSAHDGHVLERYAVNSRYEDYRRPRWRDEDAPSGRNDEDDDRADRRSQPAFGEDGHAHVLNFGGPAPDRIVPPASVPDAGPTERSRRHVVRKPPVPAPTVAKDAPDPAVAAVAPADPRPLAPKVIDVPQTKPATPAAKPEVRIIPTTQANVEPPKPEAPKIVREPTPVAPPQAKVEDKPAPKAEEPKAPPAQARVEEKPAPARKKLNDLPVGTLD